MLISISAIVAIYIACLFAPLILGIPIGLGARIFGYRILPGSLSQNLIFTATGAIGAMIVDAAYRAFASHLPWWSFVAAAVIFIFQGSRPAADVNGRGMTFGAANGIFLYLLIRWLGSV